MNPTAPPTLDPQAAARWASLATPAAPWLHEEVARRMEERLQWMTLKPAQWVHWEPLRGGIEAHELLQRRYPNSECFVLESRIERAQAAHKIIAKPWWNVSRWTGPTARFEAPSVPVQMLWANMALHMAPDPQGLMAQWHSLLASDGFLMFSCLGPDTLLQLRSLYHAQGWPLPSHEFTDMHDWGDMLVAAGFAEPVMDMERITLTFSTPQKLLDELRQLGRNLSVNRFRGLRGRRWRDQLLQGIGAELAAPQEPGRYSLSFEVVYGHAFKPKPRMSVSPTTAISLEAMRTALRQAKPGAP